jgi:F-type H+-transporting ATPase subunit b
LNGIIGIGLTNVVLAAEEGGGGLGDLGINLPTLIGQIVSFVILLALLIYFAYRPITRMLDERSNRIKSSLEEAERARAESVQAGERVKAEIEAARREGETIIAQASQMGEQLKEGARLEARKEAETILDRTRLEIDHERQETINQLRQEFVDLAITAAEKVINESLDRKAHQRLVEEVLESSPFKEAK